MQTPENLNLNLTHLLVVGLWDPDYSYHLTISRLPGGGIEFQSGFDFDLLQLLQFTSNFTYRALEGEGWIDLLENGSWSGIGRQINENEANISIAQSTFLAERAKAFTFLFPTMMGELTASFRQPAGATVQNLLTASFPTDLWIVLLVAAGLVLITVKVIGMIKCKVKCRWDEDPEESITRDQFLINEAFFWVLSAFCQKGLVGSPDSFSLRIIYIALVITSLVSFVAFSAALVSNLAVELLPIRSFADLIASHLNIYGDISLPYTHSFVQSIVKERSSTSQDPNNGLFLDVHSGIGKIMSGSGTYITFTDAVNSAQKSIGLSDDFICSNIYNYKIPGSFSPAGMVLPKGSPLRSIFNVKIAAMHEKGFIKRTFRKWTEGIFPRCLQHLTQLQRSSRPSLNLLDVYTAFVVLVGGFIGAIFGIICEKLFKKYFSNWSIINKDS